MQKGGVVLVVLVSLLGAVAIATPPNPVTEYAFAQKCYHSLDKTADHGWEKCIHKFKTIVDDFPKSELAPNALFSIGRLYQEKFDTSHDAQDLQKAFETYNVFLKAHPKEPLSDDALYRIGTMRLEKQHDKAKATKAFAALLERYPESDMALLAQKYLQKLEGTLSSPVTEPVISIEPAADEESPTLPRLPAKLPRLEEKGTSPAQENFSIKTVVIDAGHGGDDPGAIGPHGTKEAVVALQIARKLSFKLKNDLGLKTHLTRTRNKTLTLEERNQKANRIGADLFISIHANANDSSKVSGVQTFYLNNATNKAASRLATRENKSAGKKLDLSQQILSTMLQNANTDESRDLAREVHNAMVKHLRRSQNSVKDLKVDSALFYVLVGAKSPSILVETSFISNPKEEKRLKDSDFQWEVAEGIAQGVKNYLQSRQKMASSL